MRGCRAAVVDPHFVDQALLLPIHNTLAGPIFLAADRYEIVVDDNAPCNGSGAEFFPIYLPARALATVRPKQVIPTIVLRRAGTEIPFAARAVVVRTQMPFVLHLAVFRSVPEIALAPPSRPLPRLSRAQCQLGPVFCISTRFRLLRVLSIGRYQ